MATFGSLTITAPDGTSQSIALDRATLTLGREVDNDVQLGDPKSSRHHARIECDQSGCTLVDLGSANGTLVNGQRIDRVRLTGQAMIVIGDTQIAFTPPVGAGGPASERTVVDRGTAPAGGRAVSARPARRRGGFPWLIVLGAIVLLAICVVGALFLMAGGSASFALPLAPAAQTLPPPAPPTVGPPAQQPAAGSTPSGGQTPQQQQQQQPAPVTNDSGCTDDSEFLADVTIPDGTVMAPGQAFTKTWTLLNDGTCTWQGYTFVWISGDRMAAPGSVAVSRVEPGQQIDVSVGLVAPQDPGEYRANFQMQNADGQRFADMPYVIINVQGP